MSELAAPRDYLDDDSFMAAWVQMGPALQSECLRAEREIKRGTAINKDRIMGRSKYDMRGFYGLELAEENVYRLEGIPRKADDLEEAREQRNKLRTALADDAEAVERIVEMEAALEPFREHTAAQGLTLAQYLRQMVEIEQAFMRAQAALAVDSASFGADMLEAICKVADWLKFDPIQLLMDVHSGRQVSH